MEPGAQRLWVTPERARGELRTSTSALGLETRLLLTHAPDPGGRAHSGVVLQSCHSPSVRQAGARSEPEPQVEKIRRCPCDDRPVELIPSARWRGSSGVPGLGDGKAASETWHPALAQRKLRRLVSWGSRVVIAWTRSHPLGAFSAAGLGKGSETWTSSGRPAEARGARCVCERLRAAAPAQIPAESLVRAHTGGIRGLAGCLLVFASRTAGWDKKTGHWESSFLPLLSQTTTK